MFFMVRRTMLPYSLRDRPVAEEFSGHNSSGLPDEMGKTGRGSGASKSVYATHRLDTARVATC
jgi:hypothetical protein